MIKAKFFKLLALVFVTVSLAFVSSCRKKDDGPSDQELAIKALTTGSWTYDADNSDAGSGVDESDITIAFSGTSTITMTFGGDLASYVSGGSFSISEQGKITNVSIDVASNNIEIVEGTPTGLLNDTFTTLTIKFDTEASGSRASGIGAFSLKFNKAS